MFFSIGHTPLENYPCHWQMGSFSVSTDQGWHYKNQGTAKILYKGYADSNTIENLLEQISDQSCPILTGNFCALVLINDTIQIQTDRYRSFPIYIGHGVNNLVPTDRTAWTDSLVTVFSDLSVVENKFDVIGPIDTSGISASDATASILEIVDRKASAFLAHNQLPIRSFLTGGVDSMLVYSFLRKHSDKFELIKYSHVDYDYFWLKNSYNIKKFWAYNQIHHWTDSCVLTSGTPGDEFMLRSPVTADLFLKYHGIKIAELLKDPKWNNSLHRDYFSKDTNLSVFNTQSAPDCTIEELHWKLCNTVVNDWQHWHIGNTLTWTPLRDLDILKIIMRMPMDEIVGQVMNSSFSIGLIEHNCPGLSSALSDRKNSGNVLANLVNVI